MTPDYRRVVSARGLIRDLISEGWSVSTLAAALHVSTSTVSTWRFGTKTISLDNYYRLLDLAIAHCLRGRT